MSSVLLVAVVLEVLDVQELDVEVELETACARCQLVVLLLDLSSLSIASWFLSSSACCQVCFRRLPSEQCKF